MEGNDKYLDKFCAYEGMDALMMLTSDQGLNVKEKAYLLAIASNMALSSSLIVQWAFDAGYFEQIGLAFCSEESPTL